MSEYVAHRTRCGARTGSARRGRSVVGDAAGALAKHVVDACADRPLGLDASRAEVDQVVKLFTPTFHGDALLILRNCSLGSVRSADRYPHFIRILYRDCLAVRLDTSDRKSVGEGKRVSVRVDPGGRRAIQKQT